MGDLRKASLAAGAVLAVCVLGGGIGLYAGAARPSVAGSPHADSSTPPTLFPDPATMDPCALIATAKFDGLPAPAADSYGQPIDPRLLKLSVEAKGLNECEVQRGGVRVQLSTDGVRPDQVEPAKVTIDAKGPLHIAKNRPAGTECSRYVYEDGGAGMAITARPTGLVLDRSGNPIAGVDVCGTADRMTDAILAIIQSGQFPRLRYPEDSLGGIDMCELLSAAAGDTMRGADQQKAKGGHGCILSTPTTGDAPWVSITSTLQKPKTWRLLVDNPPFGGAKTVVAGRDTIALRPSLGTPVLRCTLQTAGKLWNPWPGHQIPEVPATKELTEVAELTMFLPSGTADQACQQAQDLAAKIWPRLAKP